MCNGALLTCCRWRDINAGSINGPPLDLAPRHEPLDMPSFGATYVPGADDFYMPEVVAPAPQR